MGFEYFRGPGKMLVQTRVTAKELGVSQDLSDSLTALMHAHNLPSKDHRVLLERLSEYTEMMELGDQAKEVLETTGELLSDGASSEDFKDALKKAVMAHWSNNGDNHEPVQRDPMAGQYGQYAVHGQSPLATMKADMTAALKEQAGGEPAPARAKGFVGLTLAQMAQEYAAVLGLGRMTEKQALNAVMVHTTSDFPQIVTAGINDRTLRLFEQQRIPTRILAREIQNVTRYEQGKAIGLEGTRKLKKVAEGGEIEYGTLNEKGQLLPLVDDVALMFWGSNKIFQDDYLGLFDSIPRHLANAGVEAERDLLLAPLNTGHNMMDGSPIFDASRGNVAASGSAISVTSLNDAMVYMQTQKDSAGQLMTVTPRYLLVHPTKEFLARQVLAAITPNTTADVNPISGRLEIVVEPGLADEDAWYVAGDPAVHDGLAYAYLDGQSAPRIETEYPFDRLGMKMRAVWAYGARFIETRAWYKNPGV